MKKRNEQRELTVNVTLVREISAEDIMKKVYQIIQQAEKEHSFHCTQLNIDFNAHYY